MPGPYTARTVNARWTISVRRANCVAAYLPEAAGPWCASAPRLVTARKASSATMFRPTRIRRAARGCYAAVGAGARGPARRRIPPLTARRVSSARTWHQSRSAFPPARGGAARRDSSACGTRTESRPVCGSTGFTVRTIPPVRSALSRPSRSIQAKCGCSAFNGVGKTSRLVPREVPATSADARPSATARRRTPPVPKASTARRPGTGSPRSASRTGSGASRRGPPAGEAGMNPPSPT